IWNWRLIVMQMILNNSQKLTQVLSAKLLQHLEILQFSTNELEQYIYEKANENPLLSVIDAKVKGNNEEIMKLTRSSISTQFSPWHGPVKKQFNIIEITLDEKVKYELVLLDQVAVNSNLSDTNLNILTYFISYLDDRLFLETNLEFINQKINTRMVHDETMLN